MGPAPKTVFACTKSQEIVIHEGLYSTHKNLAILHGLNAIDILNPLTAHQLISSLHLIFIS